MNLPQRIVLALGTIIVAGMVLVPPWLFIYTEPAGQGSQEFGGASHGELRIERPAGYRLLFGQHVPPSDPKQLGAIFGLPGAPLRWVIMQIDVWRLGVQLSGALAITTLVTVLFKSKKAG